MFELRLIRPVTNAHLRDGKGGEMKQITADKWAAFEAVPPAAAVDDNIEIREVKAAKTAKAPPPPAAEEKPKVVKKTRAKKTAKRAEG